MDAILDAGESLKERLSMGALADFLNLMHTVDAVVPVEKIVPAIIVPVVEEVVQEASYLFTVASLLPDLGLGLWGNEVKDALIDSIDSNKVERWLSTASCALNLGREIHSNEQQIASINAVNEELTAALLRMGMCLC